MVGSWWRVTHPRCRQRGCAACPWCCCSGSAALSSGHPGWHRALGCSQGAGGCTGRRRQLPHRWRKVLIPAGRDLPVQPCLLPTTHPHCRWVPKSSTALGGPSHTMQEGGSGVARETSRRLQGAGESALGTAAPQAGGAAGPQGSSDSAVHRLLSSRQSSSSDSTRSRSLRQRDGVSPTSWLHCCPTAPTTGAHCPPPHT